MVAGRASCHKVHEDGQHVAFLHEQPVRPGHVVLVTWRVADSVWDLTADEHDALWRTARMLALRLCRSLPCERVCVGVVGWEVRQVPTDAPGQYPPLSGARSSSAAPAALAERLRTAG